MALKKLLKAIKSSLNVEQDKIPKTILGNFIHTIKMRSMKARIADIENELVKRKTNKL